MLRNRDDLLYTSIYFHYTLNIFVLQKTLILILLSFLLFGQNRFYTLKQDGFSKKRNEVLISSCCYINFSYYYKIFCQLKTLRTVLNFNTFVILLRLN